MDADDIALPERFALLGIPHIFLGNVYHKNESFYESWTHEVPFCRFVKDYSKIPIAVEDLLEKYGKN